MKIELAFLLFLLSLAGHEAGAAVKVAFIGDQGSGPGARAVLKLIKAEGADMVLDQGDFDYQHNPEAWEKMISDILGPNFPYFASIGNHDTYAMEGYIAKLKNHLAGASCTGSLSVQSTCSYRGLFFILSAVGVAGKGHENYMRDQLAQDKSLWRICSWHIPQPEMQVGGKNDQVGWGVYEECRKGGAIIATAHEHSYSRTHLMDDFPNQHVISTENTLRLEKGRTFAFVSGLGGESIRKQKRGGPWWAAIYSKTQKANYGALFCVFGDKAPEKASCYFKDIDGNIPDEFELVSALR